MKKFAFFILKWILICIIICLERGFVCRLILLLLIQIIILSPAWKHIIIFHVFYLKKNVVSCSVNFKSDKKSFSGGIHAEHGAINKLKTIDKKRGLKRIDLLVVRFCKNGELKNSKPCCLCIDKMIKLPPEKGYKIKNVYYSDGSGNIIKSNLKKLSTEEKHYPSFYKYLKRKNRI